MFDNLLKKSASVKKNKKSGFRQASKFIKRGDIVWFSQGSHADETKVLEISSNYILLENVLYKVNLSKGAVIKNHGDGVPWEIKAPTLKKVKEGKDYYIRCDFPEKIEILNRRDNFRVAIPGNKSYKVIATVEDKRIVTRLIDISLTGAQLEVPVQDSKLIAESGRIEEAKIDIEGIFNKPLGLVIHWKRPGDTNSRIGVSFDEIVEPERSALSKLIFELERERAQQQV